VFSSELRACMPEHGILPGCAPYSNVPLLLSTAQVDVWVVMIGDVSESDLTAQFHHVLIEDERRQHAKFLFEKDRRRYLVTRSLVRYVLSRYMPIAPLDWRFSPSAFGRPLIANRHPGVDGLTFNISHSDQVVVLGVTRQNHLGIDVEDVKRSVSIDIADSFFSAMEVRQLKSLPIALQGRRFLEFWTLKESYIKAKGKGLSLPLGKFGFEMIGERQLRAHFDLDLDDSSGSWIFWQWRPSMDSIAALCVQNSPGMGIDITVRRTIPFVCEQNMVFDVLRESVI
jgi:4'-phosphopantetheinyl transferase